MYDLESKRCRNPQRERWLHWKFVLSVVLVLTLPTSACRSRVEEVSTPATFSPQSTSDEPEISVAPTAQLWSTASFSPWPTSGFSEVRAPAVAGSFYPADAVQAASMIDEFLARVSPVDGKPIALIVPHAGWAYSGHVAAEGYKQIEGQPYDTIVIIAPNHTDPTFDAISVYAKGAFDTPLGPMPIDEALAAELLSAHERIIFDRDAHQREHSIEVQLPFLRRVCPDCAFVPILIGAPTPQNLEILSAALADVMRDKQALIIASSDLSHYPSYEDAIQVDTRSLAAVETMDDEMVSAVMAAQMTRNIAGLVTCACGQGPMVVAVRVARALGADHVQILRYANSGDVGGDLSRVVGYAAVMFWRWQPPELTNAQQDQLLSIARHSLEEHLTMGVQPAIDRPSDPVLHRRLGAFVTLTLDGELRGCIGRSRGDVPLFQTVAYAAVDAALHDSRFQPLPAAQLDKVKIEISVLSPFKRVRYVHDESEIEVGRHGLYLLYDQQRALLLPQVPIQRGWNRAQYLNEICFKAGLPADCWEQATLYTFTAEVFSED